MHLDERPDRRRIIKNYILIFLGTAYGIAWLLNLVQEDTDFVRKYKVVELFLGALILYVVEELIQINVSSRDLVEIRDKLRLLDHTVATLRKGMIDAVSVRLSHPEMKAGLDPKQIQRYETALQQYLDQHKAIEDGRYLLLSPERWFAEASRLYVEVEKEVWAKDYIKPWVWANEALGNETCEYLKLQVTRAKNYGIKIKRIHIFDPSTIKDEIKNRRQEYTWFVNEHKNGNMELFFCEINVDIGNEYHDKGFVIKDPNGTEREALLVDVTGVGVNKGYITWDQNVVQILTEKFNYMMDMSIPSEEFCSKYLK